MEAAVEAQVGKITPQVASDILRDRSNSRYVNDSTVAIKEHLALTFDTRGNTLKP